MPLKITTFRTITTLRPTRDDQNVLVAEFRHRQRTIHHDRASSHRICRCLLPDAQDRANKIVILTGPGGEFITDVDWSSFGDVTDPGVWSQVHDEGVQVLENIANIRVPVIAAIEGRAHVHSDYALLASVIVAADGATFQDVAHFSRGLFARRRNLYHLELSRWSGTREAFLLNPQPLRSVRMGSGCRCAER